MLLNPQERVFLSGRTGSGKTFLIRSILTSARTGRWTVLDPKHDYDPHDPSVPIVPEFNPQLPRQVVRVPVNEAESAGWDRAIDGAYWRASKAAPEVLYVDETTLLTGARTLRPSLGRAIRTGRSRGLGVWSGTQRPKDIPSAVFTEAEHFFTFQLNFEPDREKVTEFTDESLERPLARLRSHDYVYYNVISDDAVYVHAGGRQ